ncbi:hypothetical protein [Bifidobacterium sp.]|uniref:hypothetical protein n=1 Tax=Bifidobacterium sp. TaxID=41200 RepID=UPI0028EE5FD6|nr:MULTISPECIES: hypothetical protein [Bifidobacterium]MDU5132894.1 hypothetical protein [Bifidobacterium sp.]
MTWTRIQGCTCANCLGSRCGQCDRCGGTNCARANSHRLLCNKEAMLRHKTKHSRNTVKETI